MGDDVTAAAERLLTYELRSAEALDQDIRTVASYALEAGQEVARLREALIGLASGEGKDQCWCPDGLSFHEHAPECHDARAALSTPGEHSSEDG